MGSSIYELFIDEIIKNGYKHNFFLTDLFDMHLIKKMQKVDALKIRQLWTDFFVNFDKSNEEKLNVFMGMPYCYGKCAFCIYHKEIARTDDIVHDYANSLFDQIVFFKDILKKNVFDNFYFGGGTPSLFSEDDLKRIMQEFFSYARFKENAEKSFEVNPQSASFEKFKILRDAGINRISMGVQSLSPVVLESIGREYQTEEMVLNALDGCKRNGFPQYNVDILMGLYKETKESFTEGLRKVLRFKPTTIRLYQVQPTKEYLRLFDSDLDKFYSHIGKQMEGLKDIVEYAEELGYYVPKSHLINLEGAAAITFTLKSAMKSEDVYHYNSDGNGSMFGLGHHCNCYIQNKVRYYSTPIQSKPEKNQYNMVEFSKEEEKLLFIFDRFVNMGYVSRIDFKDIYGEDILDCYGSVIEGLVKEGSISYDDELIKLLPTDAREKFICGLKFLGNEKLLDGINNIYSDNLIRIFVGDDSVVFRIDYSEDLKPRLKKIDGNISQHEVSNLIEIVFSESVQGDPLETMNAFYDNLLKTLADYRKKRGLKINIARKEMKR